ncbi:hypothetical protein BdWA1_001343 [Babesia duncani]|uniref:Uncharacterized protein n=1 Tax=Babesia duncani TaxID=323732 RepID=A0AAD9PPG7_9APIC|nr:hypothetical protein BdWA1_001343 [Babesia duncani]
MVQSRASGGPTLVSIGPSKSWRLANVLGQNSEHWKSPISPRKYKVSTNDDFDYIGSDDYHDLLQKQLGVTSWASTKVSKRSKTAQMGKILGMVAQYLKDPTMMRFGILKSELQRLNRMQNPNDDLHMIQKSTLCIYNRTQNAKMDHTPIQNLPSDDSIGSWILVGAKQKPTRVSVPQDPQAKPSLAPILHPPTPHSLGHSHPLHKSQTTSRDVRPKRDTGKETREESPKYPSSKPTKKTQIKATSNPDTHLIASLYSLDQLNLLDKPQTKSHETKTGKKQKERGPTRELSKPRGKMVISATHDWSFD